MLTLVSSFAPRRVSLVQGIIYLLIVTVPLLFASDAEDSSLFHYGWSKEIVPLAYLGLGESTSRGRGLLFGRSSLESDSGLLFFRLWIFLGKHPLLLEFRRVASKKEKGSSTDSSLLSHHSSLPFFPSGQAAFTAAQAQNRIYAYLCRKRGDSGQPEYRVSFDLLLSPATEAKTKRDAHGRFSFRSSRSSSLPKSG